MELAAIHDRCAVLLARQQAALTEMARLHVRKAAISRQIAGYLDPIAQRLTYAEQHGSYDCIVEDSENANGRRLGTELRALLDTLSDTTQRRAQHREARERIDTLLARHGDHLLTDAVTHHLGKARSLALTRLRDEGSRAAA